MTRRTTAPLLDAHRSPDGSTLAVWCSHCNVEHHHGRHAAHPDCTYSIYNTGRRAQHCTCPTGSGDGHRAAHCPDPNSPYKNTGYRLRETK